MLNKKLKSFRNARNISQRQMAEITGDTRQYVSAIESRKGNKKVSVSVEKFYYLAVKMGVDKAEIMKIVERHLVFSVIVNELKSLLKYVKKQGIEDLYFCEKCNKISKSEPCQHCKNKNMWCLDAIIEDELETPKSHNIEAFTKAIKSPETLMYLKF